LNRIAVRAGITLLLAVLLLAGFVFFVCEFMIKAEEWVVFPGSPHVYNGGNIGCGTVVDRDGTLLLDLNDGRTYADSESLRKSTVHWLGDRNGSVSAPALANYSSQIVGFDRLNGIYNYAQTGGTVELTLSAKVQVAAMEALGEHNGTVAVYNYRTGQLLCAVSTSTFDPDNAPVLDESTEQDLDGIYFNRFIQGTYIPGSIFKVVTLSAILETMPELQDETFVCTGSYAIGADEITCEGAHYEQSLKSAFCNSCNCAFAQMVERLGSETLQRYVEAFQVTESIQFDGITTAAGNFDIGFHCDSYVAGNDRVIVTRIANGVNLGGFNVTVPYATSIWVGNYSQRTSNLYANHAVGTTSGSGVDSGYAFTMNNIFINNGSYAILEVTFKLG